MIRRNYLYNVQCAYNSDHIFEKLFTIEENTENVESEVEAFCPHCEKRVSVTVQGRVVPDAELLREMEELKQSGER